MISNIRNRVIVLYHSVISSIALYPSLIATGLFLLSLGLLWVEGNTDLARDLQPRLPYLITQDGSTVRVLLSTLIGGVISLTVFSFSMVMIVLNQASSNFSPRLLPGLISDKRNQVVLGVYIGTIIFNLLILINLPAEGPEQLEMGLTILAGIILGVLCLVLFIFFIHNVSTSIQVQNIINNIYLMTRERLHYQISKERRESPPIQGDLAPWHPIYSDRAGYFEDVDLTRLRHLASEYQTDLKVVPYKGKYLLPNELTVYSSQPLDEAQTSNVLGALLFTGLRKPSSNYMYGIQEIVEVGVKAMSPGINDPGTAVMTIDYLTELLSLRMQLDALEVHATEDQAHQIELTTISFAELLHQTLSAYRLYCRHDVILMEKLLRMLAYLRRSRTIDPQHHKILEEQMAVFAEDLQEHISNEKDRARLLRLLPDAFSGAPENQGEGLGEF